MKERILQILEAIAYEDDKEVFVDRFIGVVQIDVVTDLLESLPQEQQEKIEKDFSENPDPEQFLTLFKSLFPEEDVQKKYEEAMNQAITSWVEALQPALSDEQKEKVKALSA